ncbi:MAG: hypothetical protein ABI091_30740 [Ferruginibacter sp.]
MIFLKEFKYQLLIFLGCTFFSCSENNPSIKHTLKDSVLKAHLVEIDSLDFYDTTSIDYKIIKAYYNDDSVQLKKIEQYLYSNKIFMNQWKFGDTCVHLTKLKDSKADSIYRFVYSEAFSPYQTNITISKSFDTARIHLIVYQKRRDTIPCEVIDDFDKKLSVREWNEFNNSLSSADFWGLKEDNGIHGADGSTLTVYAFIKGDNSYWHPQKTQKVSRWVPYNLPIYNSYNLLLKFIGDRYQMTQKLESDHFEKRYISKDK